MRKGISMFGKKSAIRKYKYKLRPALAKRYGGSAVYTQAQVDKTIDELSFNKRYIHYAYLMYCDEYTFNSNTSSNENREDMSNTIAAITSFGFLGSIFYSAGDDGGGGGSDGGSGGCE